MPESREETLYVIEQSSRAISEGRLESGLLWLINGLKRNPGEEELIRKLLEVVLEEVGQPTEERIDQLTWLSTYLRNHSAHVDTRNLDLILNSIEMVDRQIEEIHSGDSEKTLAQENPLNGEASQYLKTFSKNMKNKSVKECVLPSEETLDVELKQLERTLTLLDNDQDSSEVKLINDLTAWNYRIQSCLSVRDLTNKAEKMLEELRSTGIENNSDLVIYNIQNIDRLISQASSYSI